MSNTKITERDAPRSKRLVTSYEADSESVVTMYSVFARRSTLGRVRENAFV
jgi:hypothetical protein